MRFVFILLAVFTLILSACTTPAEQASPTAQAAAVQTGPAPATQASSALPETGGDASATPAGGSPAPTQAAAQLVTYRIVPGESQVSYEVDETFFNQNNRFNTAVGTTTAIEGEIYMDLANPQNSSIGTLTTDISQFRSDSNRRDGALRDRFLESSRFPTAIFTPTAITGLPGAYTPGQPVSFQVAGDLLVRDVTQPAIFDVTVTLVEDTLTGEATTTIKMSDYGFGPISIAGVLGTEDEIRLTFDFVARP